MVTTIYCLLAVCTTFSKCTTGYYIFPEYDAQKNLRPIATATIDHDYWEGCETGEGDCRPLTLIRKQKNQPYYVFLPCGGTNTGVTVNNSETKEVVEEISITHAECPPILNITNLPKGKYTLYMIACNFNKISVV